MNSNPEPRLPVRLLLPFLLPFLLSLVPLLILDAETEGRKRFAMERMQNSWEQSAAALAEDLGSGFRIEHQVQESAQHLKAAILARLEKAPQPDRAFSGRLLARFFRRGFPVFLRPRGTVVFGFRFETGSEAAILRDPDLCQTTARVMTWLFQDLANSPETLTSRESELTSRVKSILGEDLDFHTLAKRKQGQATPCTYKGRKSLFLWDFLEFPSGKIGGYFLIFPFPNLGEARILRNAVTRSFRKSFLSTRRPLVPVLVPLSGSSTGVSEIFPRAARIPKSLVRELRRLARVGERDRVFPPGIRKELPGRIWISRFPFSVDHPFEVWICSKIRETKGRSGLPSILVRGTVFAVWGGILAWVLGFGRPLPIKMKTWGTLLMMLIAAIPISALYLFGSFEIEATLDRTRRNSIRMVRERFEKMDQEVRVVRGRFENACSKITRDRKLVKLFLEPDIESPENPLLKELKRRERSEAQLDSLYIFHPWENRKGLMAINPESPSDRAGLNFYEEALLETVKIPEPGIASHPYFLERQRKSFWTILTSSNKASSLFLRAFRWRGRAALLEMGRSFFLQVQDFIAAKGRLASMIVFHADREKSVRKPLVEGLVRFGLELEGRNLGRSGLFSASEEERPEISIALGRTGQNRFEHQILLTSPEKIKRAGEGQLLGRIISMSLRSNGVRLFESSREALIGFPCVNGQGFVLAGHLKFGNLIGLAGDKRTRLLLWTFALGATVFLLAWVLGRFFLSPLADVESGMTRVSRGDLDVRVALDRDDELGDLARAFDRMIGGIKDRERLGRFVSATLDADVSRMDQPGKGDSGTMAKEGAILVSDLREFTTLSETHPIRDVIAMLNGHHQAMAEIIRQHGGFIETFVGDAIVAVFYPGSDANFRETALRAAFAMVRRHSHLQKEREKSGQFFYGMGIGIDSGEILGTTLVSKGRRDFALFGKVRQNAEKLESFSKKGQHSRIAVSLNIVKGCPGLGFSHLWGDSFEARLPGGF